MKLKTVFQIGKKGSPAGLYRLAAAMAPSAVRVDDIKLEARTGETLKLLKIRALVALCKVAGIKRSEFGDLETYGYVVSREYEQEDFNPCELLVLLGLVERKVQFDEERDAHGRLLLHARNLEQLEESADASCCRRPRPNGRSRLHPFFPHRGSWYPAWFGASWRVAVLPA